MSKDIRVQRVVKVQIDQERLWMGIRRALLVAVAEIENAYGVSPTTAELRKWYRRQSIENGRVDG